jgi:hypothetical protein
LTDGVEPEPVTPLPRADQPVPFQRAMRLAGTPSTEVNRPPM